MGIVSKHLEQYLSLDRPLRRKLHPHISQYLASRIIAPTGTLWVAYSCSPCQRASASIWPRRCQGVRAQSHKARIPRSQVYAFSMTARSEMGRLRCVEIYGPLAFTASSSKGTKTCSRAPSPYKPTQNPPLITQYSRPSPRIAPRSGDPNIPMLMCGYTQRYSSVFPVGSRILWFRSH